MSPDTARELQLRQVDEALARWRHAHLPARPSSGWIRTVREALRMSGAALARRLGVSERAARKFEASEASDRISLGTLRRVADALECDLQYALVPRQPLSDVLNQRARAVATRQLAPVTHSMDLEGQGVVDQDIQIELVARALLARSGRELW